MNEDRLLKQEEKIFTPYFIGKNLTQSLEVLNRVKNIFVGTRKDGNKEYSHPFEVAGQIIMLLDGRIYQTKTYDDIITSALLHDLLEDYPNEFEKIILSKYSRSKTIIKLLTKENYDKSKESKECYLNRYFKNMEGVSN